MGLVGCVSGDEGPGDRCVTLPSILAVPRSGWNVGFADGGIGKGPISFSVPLRHIVQTVCPVQVAVETLLRQYCDIPQHDRYVQEAPRVSIHNVEDDSRIYHRYISGPTPIVPVEQAALSRTGL